jgi:hypothetical protein
MLLPPPTLSPPPQRPLSIQDTPNRDIKRQNTSTSAVLGSLFSSIVLKGNKSINQVCNEKKSQDDAVSLKRKLDQIVAINNITTVATSKATSYFLCSNNGIKNAAHTIARQETNKIEKRLKFDEEVTTEGLFHMTEEMINMHKEIYQLSNGTFISYYCHAIILIIVNSLFI